MLCPEVINFPPPKVLTCHKNLENSAAVEKVLKLNNFYKSVIITCPDELQIPSSIEECFEDTDYYQLTNCSVTEFIEPMFVEKFIKNGSVYCLTSNRNCFTQNSAAITPEGILILHIIKYIFQTLGLEGIKRPHNFYEVKIDLKTITHRNKLKQSLSKLEMFDFYITWEPSQEDVCPSSIAKYFYESNVNVSVHSLKSHKLTPEVSEIPSIKDVELDEMVEWLGLLAHNADLSQKETYISTYSQPESEFSLKSTRICILIAKGFITPTLLSNICKSIHAYVMSRNLDNHWVCLSAQADSNSPWRPNTSTPQMFQANDSTCNIFFSKQSQLMYSLSEIKYS